MSGVIPKFNGDFSALIDGSELRREDDLLNVFRNAKNDDKSLNFNHEIQNINIEEWSLMMKSTNISSFDQSPQFASLKDFDTFNEALKSVSATIDERELAKDQIYNSKLEEPWIIQINHSYSTARGFSNFESSTSQEIFTISKLPSTDSDTIVSKFATSLCSQKLDQALPEKTNSAGSLVKSSKGKLFSRRKDVIVKTLLRKCRKFFLKDFKQKTNFMSRSKRRHVSTDFSSSAKNGLEYKMQLKNYMKKVFNYSNWKTVGFGSTNCEGSEQEEKLLIFIAIFLYHQTVEKNLDLFVGPNLSREEVKQLVVSVHDILYKYSHQKFHVFIQNNEEFKFIFLYFDKFGSKELVKDREYAAGFEIIKGQL
jgi:hypothetical protein